MDSSLLQLLWYVLAGGVAFVAHTKGRNPVWWFVYGLVLCPVAFIHAMLLKQDSSGKEHITPVSNDSEPGEMRPCPFCGEPILKKAKVCSRCEKSIEPLLASSKSRLRTPEAIEAEKRKAAFRAMYPVAGREASPVAEFDDDQEKSSPTLKRVGMAGALAVVVFVVVVGSGALKDFSFEKSLPLPNKPPADIQPVAKTNHQEFTENKMDILAKAQLALDDGQAMDVLEVLEPYADVEDGDLQALRTKANEIILFQVVRKLPSSEVEKNYEGYAELAKLDPSNTLYIKKRDHYGNILKAYGVKPMTDNSGSYPEVVAYLKSYYPRGTSLSMGKSSEPRFGKNGWLVHCEYRTWKGRGKIRVRKYWFSIRQGKVVAMVPSKS